MADGALSTLPQRLKYARVLSGFSGRRVGELAGVSAGYVIGVERARWKAPGPHALRRIAGVLGVSVEWLLEGGAPPPAECVRRAAFEAERQAVREGRARGRLRRTAGLRACPKCGYVAAAPT